MVLIVKGFTYSDTDGDPGDTVTDTNLHSLVDLSTFSDVNLADFKFNERAITVGGTAPVSPVIGDLWLENTADTEGLSAILLSWNGSNWFPIAEGIRAKNLGTFGTITFGDAVNIRTIDSGGLFYNVWLGGGNTIATGISLSIMSTDEFGYVMTRGLVRANVAVGGVYGGCLVPRAAGDGACDATSQAVSSLGFGRLLDTSTRMSLITGTMRI